MLKVILLVCCVQFAACSSFISYKRLTAIDDKSCGLLDKVFEDVTGVKNVTCMALCTSTPGCASVYYNPSTKACYGCNKLYTSTLLLLSDTGSEYYGRFAKYGEPCSLDDQCVDDNTGCDNNTCVCKPGYPLEPSTGSCVTDCVTWGSTYQVYILANLGDAPYDTMNGQLFPFDCLDQCSNDATCRSFDHSSVSGICEFNTNTATSNTLVKLNFDLLHFHYSRNCAA